MTVTFGNSSSPWLAIRSLKYTAENLDSKLAEVKSAIMNDFYLDDCLSGSNDLESAKKLHDNLISVLRDVGFELSKWSSNNIELLKDLPENKRESMPLCVGEKRTIKTLGVLWMPSDDTFNIWLHLRNVSEIKTKRQVLSAIAALYDPLGIVTPVICKAKASCGKSGSVNR